MTRDALLVDLGTIDYREAWDLQRTVATAVADGALPDTVLFLEHPPTVTLGRRADPRELHIPDDAEVEVVETDRGGRSTYHGPGQLVCYPILDLTRHGQDVKRYCRDLEETLIRALAAFDLEATRIDRLTGVWLERPPRKIASIGIHLTKWISTHGYALNVDLDPAPFTEWITACGLDGYAFTSMARELGRTVTVADVRPAAAQAFADVFGVRLEEGSAAGIRAAGPSTADDGKTAQNLVALPQGHGAGGRDHFGRRGSTRASASKSASGSSPTTTARRSASRT